MLDLDGVLVDSEERWDEARRELVADRGGTWTDEATHAMLGMSSKEWSVYVRDELGVDMAPDAISDAVVERLIAGYRARAAAAAGRGRGGPGARRALAARARVVVERAGHRARARAHGARRRIRVWLSSEEVPRGKPAPDVYLEVARRLGVDPARCAAVEDSTNGIRSAHAAGMAVVAVPMRAFPPAPEALALASRTVAGSPRSRPRSSPRRLPSTRAAASGRLVRVVTDRTGAPAASRRIAGVLHRASILAITT